MVPTKNYNSRESNRQKRIRKANNLIVAEFKIEINDTVIIPEDWLNWKFVTIPKKTHLRTCGNYRLISLMSHMLKTILRIIHARIRGKCEFDMDDAQLGFRNARFRIETREALFGINDLIHKRRDQRWDIFACLRDTPP